MNENLISSFRKKLNSNQAVIGPFMKTTDPAFVEIAGYADMDFVILDMEHGPAGIEEMQNHIRAAQVSGILPVIRVPAITEEAIGKVLDIGAAAIQIPQVTSAEEAEAVIRMAKFYPEGQRGVCRFVRAASYSAQEKEHYFKAANDTIVIIQIEGEEAVHCLDEILDVEGIDILFIGPYDLSQSLGVPGEITHERVIDKIREISDRAGKKGIVIGTFTDSYKTLKMWKDAGIKYLSYSVDVGIFFEACNNLVKQFQTL